MESKVEMREQVRERYARAATTGSCCGPECCGHDETLDADLTAGTYSQADISALPTQAVEASLGCGNPTAVAELPKVKPSSTWDRAGASTSCSPPAVSERPGSPTDST